MSKYNIQTDKEKIVIPCAGKIMSEDIVITYNSGKIVRPDTTKIQTWENVNFDNVLTQKNTGFYYTYYHSNGIDVYSSDNSSSNTGIFHLNLLTGEITQIYTTGYHWKQFFEDSKGNVYVSSYLSSTEKGIVVLNGTTATKIYDQGYAYIMFEDSKGNVYASCSTIGLLHIKENVSLIYTTGANWRYFFEDSKGNVYVGSSSSNGLGILQLSGITVTQIYTTSYGWQNFFEDSKGNVYVSSGKNLLHFNGEIFNQIHSDTVSGWIYFFEDSTKTVYLGGGNANKILVLNGKDVLSRSCEHTTTYTSFFEDSNGNVFVYGTNYGIYSGKSTFRRISPSGPWSYLFEGKNGNVYAISPSAFRDSENGILLYKNGGFERIYFQKSWKYMFDYENGVLACTTENPTPNDDSCVFIDGEKIFKVMLSQIAK